MTAFTRAPIAIGLPIGAITAGTLLLTRPRLLAAPSSAAGPTERLHERENAFMFRFVMQDVSLSRLRAPIDDTFSCFSRTPSVDRVGAYVQTYV